MSWTNFGFPAVRQPDRKVIAAVLAFAQDVKVQLHSVNFQFEGGPTLTANGDAAQSCETILNALPADDSDIMRTLNVQFPVRARMVTATIGRDPQQVYDQVTVHLSDLQNTKMSPDLTTEVIRLNAHLKKRLLAVETRAGMAALLGKETHQNLERRELELQRIEALGRSLAENLAKTTSETRLQLEEEYRALRASVEAERQANAERARAQTEERERALDDRQKALDARLADIDDRDVRHARRQIRKEQKKELEASAKEFKLTEGTQNLRRPVEWTCWVLMLLLGAGAVVSTWKNLHYLDTGAPFPVATWIWLWVKQAALTAGLVSTAVFYIRWNNRWLEQHASEEFRLKRLSLDLDRASWLVETAMEWKDKKGTEIPNVLVERLSAGLFEPEKSKETPLQPADQLASALLGASAEATIEVPGGSKIRLDRKGLKALQKGTGGENVA